MNLPFQRERQVSRNGHSYSKPEATFEMWLGKVGGLIKRGIPKYQNRVICRLMNGSGLENYHFPYLQVRKPAYWIKVSLVLPWIKLITTLFLNGLSSLTRCIPQGLRAGPLRLVVDSCTSSPPWSRLVLLHPVLPWVVPSCCLFQRRVLCVFCLFLGKILPRGGGAGGDDFLRLTLQPPPLDLPFSPGDGLENSLVNGL